MGLGWLLTLGHGPGPWSSGSSAGPHAGRGWLDLTKGGAQPLQAKITVHTTTSSAGVRLPWTSRGNGEAGNDELGARGGEELVEARFLVVVDAVAPVVGR